MLYLATAALAFVLPPIPQIVQPAPQVHALQATTVLIADESSNNLLFPTTTTLSGGLLQATKAGDVYSGELDLGDMLDTIPTSDLDLNGEKGMKRDAQGIQRLKARTAIQEKRAFNKYLEVMEEEAAQDAAPSFFK